MTAPAPVASPGPASPGPASPPDDVVLGDGTTAGARARSRWRRAQFPLVVVAVVVVAAVLGSLLTARVSQVPLAPDNPGPNGGRALAQILQGQGVRIEYVRTVAAATAAAQEGTTLLVATSHTLFEDQVDRLAAVPADTVLVAPVAYHVPRLTGDALETRYGGAVTLREAGCDDPDAVAAEEIRASEYRLRATSDDATVCFTGPEGEDGSFGVVQDGRKRVVVIPDGSLMSNAALAEHGNAALLLRSLGHHETLVWYVPSMNDTGVDGPAGPGLGDLLPPWAGAVALHLVVVALALALWRGRRLGPVVTEPLPVTVRAAETTLGRGRLYRRARSRGHAAAALRAGTAHRAAGRLGLPRSAGAADVIDAVARATGRSTEQVAGLLYGPPPQDDAGLLDLARRLDELESEVHRT